MSHALPELRLPEALSDNERDLARAAFAKAADAEGGEFAAVARDAAKWGNLVFNAYDALLMRVRLAELALYRAQLLADDQKALIDNGHKQRAGGPTAEGIANMTRVFVRDYIAPILPLVRDPLGFTEGDESRGWYLVAEEWRAKIVGHARARARLDRDGFGR